MGFLRKVGGAAATGTGAVLGTVFDRKTRNLFKNRFIGKKPPLNAHEVAEIAAQLKPESLDNENFRLQAQKISITKHHAEREINNAIDKVAKTVGPDLAFPKDKAEAEKLWAELGLELSTIEKSVLPFSFSIRTFMTIYQHELQNLAAEEIQTKKIAKEVGIREKEIEFLERSLGTNGVFNQLLEEIRECNQKTNLCDQIVSSHVAAEAGEKKLDGAALMPFTFSFREISKKEKAATKLVHQFFKRNKGKITNFEIQAQIAAHAARQNTKMFFAYLGDKALSYFTIGNGLTVLALVGLMAATGGMGSEAIMARKPIFNILGKITNTLTGVKFTWLTTFFKPAQAAAMAEVSEGRLKRALKQAMNYF